LASDKKLAFKLELAPNLPPGHGDGRRLTQVLINLVGNAIKFTDTGEVAIKAEANNGAFHVSVCDTGPGISAADQAKLSQKGRHRLGTGHLEADHRDARRPNLGRVTGRSRFDVHVHASGRR